MEFPDLDEQKDEKSIKIEVAVQQERARSGLKSLQNIWEEAPARDIKFLSKAERLFVERSVDKDTPPEGTRGFIDAYFNRKKKDFVELDSSGSGGIMSKTSGNSIAECNDVFLKGILAAQSAEEVSNYATALLDRVSRMISDVGYNRDEIKKIRAVIDLKSYNAFGYDNRHTTKNIDELCVEEGHNDDAFFNRFQDSAHTVKDAVNALATLRLQQLRKPNEGREKIEALV